MESTALVGATDILPREKHVDPTQTQSNAVQRSCPARLALISEIYNRCADWPRKFGVEFCSSPQAHTLRFSLKDCETPVALSSKPVSQISQLDVGPSAPSVKRMGQTFDPWDDRLRFVVCCGLQENVYAWRKDT